MDPETFRKMRLTFVSEIAAAVPRVRAHLDVLRENPEQTAALEEARRFFHRIAGTAASVDLADLGRVALMCERFVTTAQRSKTDDLLEHVYPILDDGLIVVTHMIQDAAGA